MRKGLCLSVQLVPDHSPRLSLGEDYYFELPGRHSLTALKAAKPHNPVAYSETFKDHIQNPRNVGELSDATITVEETNPVCGDRIRLSLRVHESRIEAVRFLAYGCPPTLVCGSVLTEMIEGKSVEEALGLTRKDLVDEVGGLPSRKQHAAALAIETLRAALSSL